MSFYMGVPYKISARMQLFHTNVRGALYAIVTQDTNLYCKRAGILCNNCIQHPSNMGVEQLHTSWYFVRNTHVEGHCMQPLQKIIMQQNILTSNLTPAGAEWAVWKIYMVWKWTENCCLDDEIFAITSHKWNQYVTKFSSTVSWRSPHSLSPISLQQL